MSRELRRSIRRFRLTAADSETAFAIVMDRDAVILPRVCGFRCSSRRSAFTRAAYQFAAPPGDWNPMRLAPHRATSHWSREAAWWWAWRGVRDVCAVLLRRREGALYETAAWTAVVAAVGHADRRGHIACVFPARRLQDGSVDCSERPESREIGRVTHLLSPLTAGSSGRVSSWPAIGLITVSQCDDRRHRKRRGPYRSGAVRVLLLQLPGFAISVRNPIGPLLDAGSASSLRTALLGAAEPPTSRTTVTVIASE